MGSLRRSHKRLLRPLQTVSDSSKSRLCSPPPKHLLCKRPVCDKIPPSSNKDATVKILWGSKIDSSDPSAPSARTESGRNPIGTPRSTPASLLISANTIHSASSSAAGSSDHDSTSHCPPPRWERHPWCPYSPSFLCHCVKLCNPCTWEIGLCLQLWREGMWHRIATLEISHDLPVGTGTGAKHWALNCFGPQDGVVAGA